MDFCSTFIVISFYSFLSSYSGSKTPLQSFLGIAEQHTAHNGVSLSSARALTSTHTPPTLLSASFNEHCYLLLPFHISLRATCPSAPVLTTPQPSQLRNTSTRSSTWTAATLDAPLSLPAKFRGKIHNANPCTDVHHHPYFSFCCSASILGLKQRCGWASLTLCPWPNKWHPS